MTVVVGWIATPEGAAALAAATEQAGLRGTGLLVVNASDGDATVDPRYATGADVAAVRSSLAAQGLDAAVEQDVGGDPVDRILALTEREDVDLLVIGLRRRSPVGKLLLGSRAQRLLLHARCPVLAVKA